MSDLYPIIIGVVILSVAFVLLARAGAFLKISAYWAETMQELKKCTWPTWDELVGSTAVVIVAVALIGGFTVGIDFGISFIISHIV
jgi:preprotein translocase subunit SecE